jgi:hypothetical protein
MQTYRGGIRASNSLAGFFQVIFFKQEKWWTRSQRIRTAAEVPFEVAMLDIEQSPIYQRIAFEAKQLQGLGMSFSRIAEQLGVDHKTVAKSIRWLLVKRGK